MVLVYFMRKIQFGLNNLPKIRDDSIKRKRISSYDKEGDNYDWIAIKPEETVLLGEVEGSGCITHIWCTCVCKSKYYLRNAILRMYWDREPENTPSVEVPLGDFFGMGHAKRENFNSAPLQMSPHKGKGFNCWFPMPFSKKFRITLENDNPHDFRLYYYIDYEYYEDEDEISNQLNNNFGRFHAQWRRENPPKVKRYDEKGKKISKLNPFRFNLFGVKNKEPIKYNYKILEAKGKGHYVGCNLNIDNRTFLPYFLNWPGEGDDMIFIDGDVDKKKPTLYGTGTEDYVNQAFSQRENYSSLYHGTILAGGFNWYGKITYYRYHILDPVYFNEKILVTIEHGHDNHRADDWSSTAYWYQMEPHDHKLFPKLPNKERRNPQGISWSHILRKSVCILVTLFLVFWFLLSISKLFIS